MPPTIEQLAAKYANQLRLAADTRAAAFDLVDEINDLPLTRADKLRIVDLVSARFMGPRHLVTPTPRSGGDNARYLSLVAALKGLIR